MASQLDSTHLAMISLGGAMVFSAIRQSNWKHPMLIHGLLWGGLLLGLVAIAPIWLPPISTWVHSIASPMPPDAQAAGWPQAEHWWSVFNFSFGFLPAGIIQVIRWKRGVPSRSDAFMTDALNFSAIFVLFLLATSIAFGWPASPSETVSENKIAFLLVITYAITVIAEVIAKGIGRAMTS